MCSGTVPKNLDAATNQFLYEHLPQLALFVKDNSDDKRKYIKNIENLDNITPKPIKTYNRKKKASQLFELTCLSKFFGF